MKYVGLSECTADQIRRAHAVTPITAVEIEWSLWERGNEVHCICPSPNPKHDPDLDLNPKPNPNSTPKPNPNYHPNPNPNPSLNP